MNLSMRRKSVCIGTPRTVLSRNVAQGAFGVNGIFGLMIEGGDQWSVVSDQKRGARVQWPVENLQPPKVIYRVPRNEVPRLLSRVLNAHQVVDVVVADPPLEEIIAEVFSLATNGPTSQAAATQPSSTAG